MIPKGARDKFRLVGGTRLIVLSDDDGIAMIPAERFKENMRRIMALAATESENEGD